MSRATPSSTHVILQQVEHAHLGESHRLGKLILCPSDLIVCVMRAFGFSIQSQIQFQHGKQTK